MEPLEGAIDLATNIFCEITGIGDASEMMLLANGEDVFEDERFSAGMQNETHREFVLFPTMSTDRGTVFACQLRGLISPSVKLEGEMRMCDSFAICVILVAL